MMGIITSLLMTLNRLSADLSGSFQIGESCAERAGPIPDPRPPTSQPDVSMDMNIRVSGFPPSLMAVAACVLLAIVATGCSTGPQIRSATAPGADLGNDFRTFGFFPELSTDRAGLHTIVSRELVSATRREMEVRGFTFVENSAKADLLINFHTDVSDQFRVRSTPHYWHGSSFWNHRRGFYDPWFGHHRWPSHSAVELQQFSQGALSVDIVDTASNMLVWEGVATTRLTQRTLNDLGPALDDAVHRMFKRFPVPAVF